MGESELVVLALDIEATSPQIMSGNSIPSIGAVVYSLSRGVIRSQLFLIAPVGSDYAWDAGTHEWWAGQPDMLTALANARVNGLSPAETGDALAAFIRNAQTEFPQLRIVVDCSFDIAGVQHVLGTRLALHMHGNECVSVINTHNVYLGILGSFGSLTKRIDAKFGLKIEAKHTHNPVDDATGIAERFVKVMDALKIKN